MKDAVIFQVGTVSVISTSSYVLMSTTLLIVVFQTVFVEKLSLQPLMNMCHDIIVFQCKM